MRPLRFLLPLSTFLFRIGVVFFIYVQYFNDVLELSFDQLHFYLSSLFSIFGILLVFGAFAKRQTLTVLSGLILFLLGLYEIISFIGEWLTIEFVSTVFFTLVALFFLCNGNKHR
ncbi:hypothetical protein AKJ55_00520 [candidate division MSBL1 archaeon SCGC-AAA382M17]|uniref:Uncharacterized protein n=1 Tax=candidate division MSBL1 archaeon SCGC-AAA382M17 TaxID=1698284 RepID=A0ABR5TJW3_9EURY|nr:hypothetical protein AKJ55_00520 [candidate division MSBL1 archaeon SCGC-AAA382M17]